jgi:hypothetical protein
VNFPAVGFGIGQVGLRHPAARPRPVELAVEADANLLEVECRIVFRARGEADIGAIELGVEIFGPHAPVRREGVLHAGARRPAGTDVDVLLVGADVRRIDEALAGESETTGGVNQPVSAGIAEAAPHGPDIVQLLDHIRPRAGERGDDRVRDQVVRKGEIGFDAEHQA